MTEQLTDDMHPAMVKLQNDIERQSVEQLRVRKMHALDTLSRMANAKLMSYWVQWAEVTQSSEHRLQKNFKELLCRRYNGIMH